jgi:hypothetical protein
VPAGGHGWKGRARAVQSGDQCPRHAAEQTRMKSTWPRRVSSTGRHMRESQQMCADSSSVRGGHIAVVRQPANSTAHPGVRLHTAPTGSGGTAAARPGSAPHPAASQSALTPRRVRGRCEACAASARWTGPLLRGPAPPRRPRSATGRTAASQSAPAPRRVRGVCEAGAGSARWTAAACPAEPRPRDRARPRTRKGCAGPHTAAVNPFARPLSCGPQSVVVTSRRTSGATSSAKRVSTSCCRA